MAKFRRKGTWKKILAGALAVVLGVGAIAGISALVKKADEDIKSISPKFSVGGLTATGAYEETDKSIYTKDAFECQGLIAKLEFDSSISYELFFYDVAGNFIESTGNLTEGYSEELPYEASYARVEITPIWDDEVKEADRVIKWYNVRKYSKQLNLEVLKEQDTERVSYAETLSEEATLVNAPLLGLGTYNFQNDSFSSNATSPWYWYGKVTTTNYDEMIIRVKTECIGKVEDFANLGYETLLLYAPPSSQGNLSSLNPETLKVEGSYTYLSVNVSSFDTVVFTTDYEVKAGLSVWLR